MQRGRFLILIALLLILSIAGIFLAVALSGGLPGILGGRARGAETPLANGETPIAVTATPQPVLQILAAGQNLQRGAVIPTEALIAIPWPTSIVPPSAITNPVDIVGTRARYTIARGEPIFSTMIVQSLLQISPFGSDAAAQIPPGFVGISIPYSRTNGVALGIKDGDHVNVIVSWSIVDIDQQFQTILPNLSAVLNPPNPDGALNLAPSVVGVVNETGLKNSPVGRGEVGVNTNETFYVVPSEPQRARLVTQGIIQDALVLHVGDFGANKPEVILPTPTAVPNATASAPPPPTATPLPPDIITLVVSPQDSLVLNYVNRIVEKYPGAVAVTLALRSAGDTSRVDTESVTLQYMFQKFNIALPAKLNYGVNP
jgi:Flp pilus assembly protein CpaB